MSYKFLLPDVGEGLHEAEILTWFVEVGESVQENDELVEIQTDKAAVVITSPVTGKIIKRAKEAGEVMHVGDILVEFETDEITRKEEVTEQAEEKLDLPKKARIVASPSLRKLARTKNIDLSEIKGSGAAGRVLRSDFDAYIAEQGRSSSVREKPSSEPLKREKIKGIRKTIFNNMEKSAQGAVQCTAMDEVEVTELIRVRKLLNQASQVDITFLPLIIKAVSAALKAHPLFNSRIDLEEMEIVYSDEINISLAVATAKGLLVPVIKAADKKSVEAIARELVNIKEKAENDSFDLADFQEGTFTVSSTGPTGGVYATPIINHPQVAILGVHRIVEKPIVKNGEIVIGNMMSVSLTFDHRIIDGEPVGRFMQTILNYLKTPELLLLPE